MEAGTGQDSDSVRFGLLGPLKVIREGSEITPRASKQRLLLAALLVEPGRPVSADRLVGVLWDGSPPPTARASLGNQVFGLRRTLADSAGRLLRTVPHGYLLDAAPGTVDAQIFEDLLHCGRAAHRAEDWAMASAVLGAALALWRGEPVPELRATGLLAYAAARWSEQRLQALEWRIESDLRLGRHPDVTAELAELTATHPLREGLAGLLMTAHYQSGRRGDALSVYRRTRQVLVDELGVDPGAPLQELHLRILAGDPVLPSASSRSWPVVKCAARPGLVRSRRPATRNRARRRRRSE